MRRLTLCVLLLGSLLYPATQKRKQPKPPELEVLEASAHRTESDVAMDGRVRNTGEKPISGIVLMFDFLEASSKVITTKRIVLDVESLPIGEETDFHVRVADPVRAVEFRINASDRQDRELRVAKNGPFPIE